MANDEMKKSIRIRGKTPDVLKQSVCKSVHIALIVLLVVVLFLAFFDQALLVRIYRLIGSIGDEVAKWTFYIDWITRGNKEAEFARAYLVFLYLVLFAMFVNLFIAGFPQFGGDPKVLSSLSIDRLHQFIHGRIYSGLKPSMSGDRGIFIIWTRHPELIFLPPFPANVSYRDLIKTYFSVSMVRRGYLIYLSVGFAAIPFLAYASKAELLTVISFKLTFLFPVMVYLQVRCIFEFIVLALPCVANAAPR